MLVWGREGVVEAVVTTGIAECALPYYLSTVQ